jgi:uncharacterized protein YbaR (Trm112 family)
VEGISILTGMVCCPSLARWYPSSSAADSKQGSGMAWPEGKATCATLPSCELIYLQAVCSSPNRLTRPKCQQLLPTGISILTGMVCCPSLARWYPSSSAADSKQGSGLQNSPPARGGISSSTTPHPSTRTTVLQAKPFRFLVLALPRSLRALADRNQHLDRHGVLPEFGAVVSFLIPTGSVFLSESTDPPEMPTAL